MKLFFSICVFALSVFIGMYVNYIGMQINLEVGSIFSISFVGAVIVYMLNKKEE